MMAISRVMSRRSQAGSRMLRNPSITIWPASVPVMVEFWPEASSATANRVLANVVPEQRRQQPVRIADVGDLLMAGLMEGGRRQDQDRRVDEEGEQQRHGGIERGEADRLPLATRRRAAPSGSARWSSADRGCAASRWRPGCRSRCRASPGWSRSRAAAPARPAPRPWPGCAMKSSTAKQTPIVATSAMTNASR